MRFLVLLVAAVTLGVAVGELLFRSAAVRDLAGRSAGRGRLVAIVNEKGIYETDLGEDVSGREELIAGSNLERLAGHEPAERAEVDRQLSLLAAQFGNPNIFGKALGNDGLSLPVLREKLANHLRSVAWLEKKVRPAPAASEQECRQFYTAHPDFFTQPVRYRASHLLLAAHAETPPEVVEEKELGIAALSARLEKGEAFEDLIAEASEDEATKARGGDLGVFSDVRMPEDFMTEIKKLRPGETSKPFRTHLGFHIARLTEVKQSRLLTFEEARPEISLAIANERRADAMARVVALLAVPGKALE